MSFLLIGILKFKTVLFESFTFVSVSFVPYCYTLHLYSLLQADFGCGSGSLLDSLLDYPTSLQSIIGVDISPKGLARAAKVT